MENKATMKDLIKELVKSGEIKTIADINNVVKDLTKDLIQTALETELTNHLGYDKYEHEKLIKDNYRNGNFKKTLKSSSGEMIVDIPRDRNGTFEPQIVPKYKTDISDIESKIIVMYAKGLSTKDIEETMNEIYGISLDSSTISKITDKILPKITEWQNRPLEKVYPIVFIDGIRFKVKENNRIVEKSVYIVMGYDLDGFKDVLGFWIAESESSKQWLSVFNDLKTRGLERIYVICCDNLTGISSAINSAFPKTIIQKCIVHQIRNSLKFVNYKDLKEFTQDMKKIYQANSLEESEFALDEFENKWASKYKYAINSWRENFQELVSFFAFPKEVRKIIYTTNVIENLNRNIRKISKTKGSFPTENSIAKIVYFAIQNQLKKWNKMTPNWGSILSQFLILFEEENF